MTVLQNNMSLLLKDESQIQAAKLEAQTLVSVTLTQRQLCDIELLLDGSFAPLRGFMNKQDYESVLSSMRLANGALFPVPITLDTKKDTALNFAIDQKLALRDAEGNLVALMQVESVWEPSKENEAQVLYGTTQQSHKDVFELFQSGSHYVGGTLTGVTLPIHYDFTTLRKTPQEIRSEIEKRGWQNDPVVAYHSENILNKCHLHQTLHASRAVPNSRLLVHPAVGISDFGDLDYYTRVRCYKGIVNQFPQDSTLLAIIPLVVRPAGFREYLLHALIRKNYGCTHIVVDKNGSMFESLTKHANELGIIPVLAKPFVYVKESGLYVEEDKATEGTYERITETELKERLSRGVTLPDWLLFPETIQVLKEKYPPRWKQGFTIFFTGLSGAGKSTIANALIVRLMELSNQPITLLDGDIVRTHLSSELGFSKEHRDLNIKRIGYVASEITKSGGIAITAAIAPYAAPRSYARQLIEKHGGFLEIYMSTPLEVCERRDTKGLYAKARKGLVKGFTGIDDPYEAPTNPEISLSTTGTTIKHEVEQIVMYLVEQGYVRLD